MVRTHRALLAVAAMALPSALLTAAPAQADEATYLKATQTKYVFLSQQQLLTEGYKVCSAAQSGALSSTNAATVQNDLKVSVAAAVDIVAAAVVNLDC